MRDRHPWARATRLLSRTLADRVLGVILTGNQTIASCSSKASQGFVGRSFGCAQSSGRSVPAMGPIRIIVRDYIFLEMEITELNYGRPLLRRPASAQMSVIVCERLL